MTETQIFELLSDEHREILSDALPLITILVAGADDNIDEQELNWAEKLTHIRTYAEPAELNEYYTHVEVGFEQKVDEFIKSLPTNISSREEILTEKLSLLNEVFSCLPNKVAFTLYESFTSFAKHIAKASGGFLRFGSISSSEKKWIALPMIIPIVLEMEEDYSEE